MRVPKIVVEHFVFFLLAFFLFGVLVTSGEWSFAIYVFLVIGVVDVLLILGPKLGLWTIRGGFAWLAGLWILLSVAIAFRL